ncbi:MULTISPECIES: ELKS/Rab6-interacting/CAST family protein [Desulfovibrio]|uniref:ELKS/Rab6-interacting/CAST family protein n=1 Tax=Desulfovibrio TaxID=872 RepID=UPI001C030705|nr:MULTISPECIES: ELKS/Rab6-interacting/CAST family protein [Desulfovibrio]MBT9749879.1 hypothetical protein [Desulfovibrio desulfuricans]HZF61955.1 hypothetical protein [Desulfovibrio sp.]
MASPDKPLFLPSLVRFFKDFGPVIAFIVAVSGGTYVLGRNNYSDEIQTLKKQNESYEKAVQHNLPESVSKLSAISDQLNSITGLISSKVSDEELKELKFKIDQLSKDKNVLSEEIVRLQNSLSKFLDDTKKLTIERNKTGFIMQDFYISVVEIDKSGVTVNYTSGTEQHDNQHIVLGKKLEYKGDAVNCTAILASFEGYPYFEAKFSTQCESRAASK